MSAKQLGNSSSGVLYTDRRDFYIRPNIVKELWTDVTPFTTVISNRGVVSGLADPTYKMFEHRNPWQKQEFQITQGGTDKIPDNNSESPYYQIVADSAVGLNSTVDASYLGLVVEIWDSAKAVKRGVALVTTADGSGFKFRMLSKSDTVGGIGNTGGAGDQTIEITPVTNDYCIVVGNAHAEGSSAPEAWSDELEVVYNQCQIFKTPLQITGTLLEASLRGESSELARLRDQKSQEHKIQKERAFLYGMHPWNLSGGFSSLESIAASDGGAIRTTMGIIPAIENNAKTGDDQNNFTISEASYSYGAFVDDMEKVFHYVPEAGSKRAFVGAGALGYFSKMSGASGLAGNSGWTVSLGDMKRDGLGFNYRMLETPHGMLQLIPTPSLRGPYNKSMVVVSDENLSLMQYRRPKFQANIKTDNAYDGVKDQYFSDEGIGLTLIESHKLFKITD